MQLKRDNVQDVSCQHSMLELPVVHCLGEVGLHNTQCHIVKTHMFFLRLFGDRRYGHHLHILNTQPFPDEHLRLALLN